MNSTASAFLTNISDNVSVAVADVETVTSLSSYVKTVVVTLGVIFNMFGVVGNVCIVCVIARDKTLRKPYNALLASMAVDDIVRCGILNMIQVAAIHLEEFPLTWPSQHTICVIHAILWVQLILMIPLHIMVIAVHRFLIVYHQKLNERITNKRTIGILICALHILSFALLSGRFKPKIPFRFISSYGQCKVKLSDHSNLTIASLITFLAVVLLLFSYIRVYHKVSASKKQLQLVSIGGAIYGNQRRRLQIMTQHEKILFCMVVIVILLIITYISAAVSAGMANRISDISPSIVAISMVCVWISSVMNSVVYGIFDPRFRNGFKRLFLCNNRVGPVES